MNDIAGNIKGITIEINGETKRLEEALKKVNKSSTELNKELREIDKSLKFNPGNTELLEQKQRALGTAVENTKKKLEQLKTAQEQAAAALERGDIGQDEYDALRREIIKTENQLKSLEGQANKTAQAFKGMSDKLMSAGSTLTSAGDTMTRNVTMPLTALGTLSVKFAADFDSAMVGVRKTTDLTDEEFAQMTQTIRDMAKELPATAVEIAGVTEAAGQLGIAKENLTEFAEVMINLGETTNLTADEAASAFARFANITQMPQSEFENLGSTVVALGNNMATTEAEIVRMGMRLAASAKQIGLTEAETMGLAAAMSSVGIEAEAGGSAMSTTMKRINSAVLSSMGAVNEEIEHFTKVLSGTGVTLDEVFAAAAEGEVALQALADRLGGTWDVQSLEEVVGQFEAATVGVQGFADVAGMSAEEFSEVWKNEPTEALTLFINGLQGIVESGGDVNATLADLEIKGLRETDTLSRLAGAGDLLAGSFDLANKAFEENTALSAEAELRYASFGAKFDMFKNKAKDVAITIGNVLLPAVEDMITAIGEFANKLSTADQDTVKFAVTLGVILAAIGPILKIFGGVATVLGTVSGALAAAMGGAAATTPVMAALAAVFTKVGVALTAIAGVVGVSVGAVAAAIVGLIAAGVLLYTHWDEIKAKATEIWGGLKDYFSTLWTNIQTSWSETWTGITTWLTELWNGFISTVQPIWDTLTNVFTVVWMAIKEVFNLAWTAISTPLILAWNTLVATAQTIFIGLMAIFASIWEQIGGTVTSAWNTIKTTLTNVWNSIKAAVSPVFTAIATTIATTWENIKTKASEVWNAIKSTVEGIWNAIKTKATEVFDAIKSKLEEVWNAVKSKAEEIWNGIKSTLEGIWDGLKTKVQTTFDEIKTKISEVWENIKTATKEAWEAVKNAIETPINAARDAVQSAIDKIKSILNIDLPVPKIKLPHFKVSGSFSINPPSVPSFGVEWYDKGGIFSSPTVIGVGEKRPEFVGALDDLREIVADVIDNRSGVGSVLITGNTFNVRDDNDIKRIAQEIYKMTQKNNRGKGLVTPA